MSTVGSRAMDMEGRWQIVEVHETALDGGGGIALEGLVGSVRVQARRLRALDVQNSPGLVELDLSDCAGDLVLALKELPALTRVRLPESNAGLRIELALAPGHRSLLLEGRVADLGVCAEWMDHRLRLDEFMEPIPVEGVMVMRPGVLTDAGGAEVCLSLGRGQEAERIQLDCRGLRALIAIGGRCRKLRLDNAELARLEVSENPMLEAIDGGFRAEKAEIALCSSLRSIAGQGGSLNIDCCRTERIIVDGHWCQVRIGNGDLWQARLESVDQIQLESTPALHDLRVGPGTMVDDRAAPLGLNSLMVHLEQQPERLPEFVERCGAELVGGRGRLHDWLTGLAVERQGESLAKFLFCLNRLIERGADARSSWRLRCLVHGLINGVGFAGLVDQDFVESVNDRWQWPSGLLRPSATWTNDLRLYTRCRHLPEAAYFARSLAQPRRLRHLETLARVRTEPDAWPGLEPVPIEEILERAIPRLDIHAELAADSPYTDLTPRDAEFLHRVMRAQLFEFIDVLLEAGQGNALECLVESLARLPSVRLLGQVGVRLHDLGIESARMLLGAALRDADELGDQLRGEVLSRLFAPVPVVDGAVGCTG